MLRLVLFNIITVDTDCGIECKLSTSVDKAKFCGVVNTWTCANLIEFYKNRCKEGPALGWGNPKHRQRLGDE